MPPGSQSPTAETTASPSKSVSIRGSLLTSPFQYARAFSRVTDSGSLTFTMSRESARRIFPVHVSSHTVPAPPSNGSQVFASAALTQVQALLSRRRFAAELFKPNLFHNQLACEHHVVLTHLMSLLCQDLVVRRNRSYTNSVEPFDRSLDT